MIHINVNKCYWNWTYPLTLQVFSNRKNLTHGNQKWKYVGRNLYLLKRMREVACSTADPGS